MLKADELESQVCDSIAEECQCECMECDPSDPGSPCYGRYIRVMRLLEEAEATLQFWPGED